ncbi:uncharacterized protein LOC129739054 isoform X2 [Uranotaenia lowii]|uniref:uncharacterized protein LOC129739054 isoform X2 n=1 Tax=Uranotaenia lowii TaxID=190385 RepID=UPI00247957A0|nr:uncharacterized protein LOC129739054 isoform X2 [Uranotaenia lowii]
MASSRGNTSLRKSFKTKDCILYKDHLKRPYQTMQTRYIMLPIHNKNKYYKQCNTQINRLWQRKRKSQLRLLEAYDTLPSHITLESGKLKNLKVLAYCSISKIPACSKRCFLEIIVRDDYCYYLNIEKIFIATRDPQIMRSKFSCNLYRSSETFKPHYIGRNNFHDSFPKKEMRKKYIITTKPNEWIDKDCDKDDLYQQRQNNYYYYYYNEDEDDDTYFYDCRISEKKFYEGPPPPTSNEPFMVVPIHNHPELKEQCVRLINNEWPRSRMARFWSFEFSSDSLPISLVITQLIDGEQTVLGHAKLSPVLADTNAAYLESVVVDERYRGRGIGTYLVTEAEKYCSNTLNIDNVYLATDGQEVFYAKLGYIFCKAINIFGTDLSRKTGSRKHWMKKVLSDWIVPGSENMYKIGSSNQHQPVNKIPHGKAPVKPPTIDELLKNIRQVVYINTINVIENNKPKTVESPLTENESMCDLIFSMHSINISTEEIKTAY